MSIKISYGWNGKIEDRHTIFLFDSDKRKITIDVSEIKELILKLEKADKDYTKKLSRDKLLPIDWERR